MNIKTGLEIVKMHSEYQQKIRELEVAINQLADYDYCQTVLREQLSRLRSELVALEDTRFQALEPVVIGTSLLGGK
ncbi:hypothetical protein [Sporolituus thermophilus]|uniref:Uncharacterized protein n=1 Tax=Sporolituus thermophilus DSM 23256 TaxID=1123285 RepID=A0A1G7MSI7_9FIRM|nr:hypothetical protein [Sporolituus thermophilus]SDF64684.1 hypothetical protein SAMN05660235_02282 [Sporolituus thermophilus DSM 23256]